MFNSLFSKLISTYIAVILITLLVLGAAMSYLLGDYYYSTVEQELLSESRELAGIIAENTAQDSISPGVMAALNRISKNRVFLISREDLIQMAYGGAVNNPPPGAPPGDQPGSPPGSPPDAPPNGLPLRLAPQDAQLLLEGKTVTRRGHLSRPDQVVIFAVVPVLVKGEATGALFSSAPLADITEAVRAVRRIMLIAAIPALLLAALFGLLISRSLAGPLGRLSEATVQIAGGDYRQRVEIVSGDEIGRLGQNFNRMALSLEDTVGALAREKGKIESILANMDEGVVAVDNDNRVILINRQAVRTLGSPQNGRLTAQQALPQESLSETNKQNQQSARLSMQPGAEVIMDRRLKELFAAVLASGESCSEEYTPDGGQTFIQAHVSRLTDQDGHGFGAVGVLQDITEIKKLDQLRRDFVANVSHELRTPMTSVQGYIEAMLDSAIPIGERDKYLEVIYRETLRLNKLIYDLLDLSMIESGKEKWELNEIEIPELVGQVLLKLQPLMEKRRVTVDSRFTGRLPPVPGDEDRIEQVIFNLLDNAIKFSPAGGVVTLRAEEADDKITVSVTDRGPGIPLTDMEHIWERFHRVEKSRSRALGGTGLGLAIVKQIVEAHGGTVNVHSVAGEGSTFSFTLATNLAETGFFSNMP
ncbi:two-component system, OmpR family, sensor histidine kinase ResE [Desulfotomaculum arcticum]|uniref:histidine kinase n=1 Tax=Desulfotruncus arcticus DSM 17038 TaxID=1121424 RepID=A0A1I2NQF7_9FIRM|nr:ATP-binding protein [Desulfotruncus arcticus]SFG06144.1 two-component system, OmpR family, sensor histidine kinase ResE [Desulfotomaculum arcticum] [Desulfotruncus arcticus DSM 17038]